MLFNLLSDFVNAIIVLLSILYLFSFLFMITHEVVVRLYILIKTDKEFGFNIPWFMCVTPVFNTISVLVSLDYLYFCIGRRENYLVNTARQYYENKL